MFNTQYNREQSKNILKYAVGAAVCFGAGALVHSWYSDSIDYDRPHVIHNEQGSYLVTEGEQHIISNQQVGSLEHRVEGLLDEDPEHVRSTVLYLLSKED